MTSPSLLTRSRRPCSLLGDPEEHLTDYIGMADAYAGFDGLYIARRPIIEAACWSTRAAQSYSSSPSCRRRRSSAKTLSAMAASSFRVAVHIYTYHKTFQ